MNRHIHLLSVIHRYTCSWLAEASGNYLYFSSKISKLIRIKIITLCCKNYSHKKVPCHVDPTENSLGMKDDLASVDLRSTRHAEYLVFFCVLALAA